MQLAALRVGCHPCRRIDARWLSAGAENTGLSGYQPWGSDRGPALKADGAESSLCGYMAWIALAGLAVSAIWHKPWADPVAALALIPLILREGWEALHASRPGCGCP